MRRGSDSNESNTWGNRIPDALTTAKNSKSRCLDLIYLNHQIGRMRTGENLARSPLRGMDYSQDVKIFVRRRTFPNFVGSIRICPSQNEILCKRGCFLTKNSRIILISEAYTIVFPSFFLAVRLKLDQKFSTWHLSHTLFFAVRLKQ